MYADLKKKKLLYIIYSLLPLYIFFGCFDTIYLCVIISIMINAFFYK